VTKTSRIASVISTAARRASSAHHVEQPSIDRPRAEAQHDRPEDVGEERKNDRDAADSSTAPATVLRI